ncbi:MAG: hypothetical protein GY860_08735 [Desulfobacteraceae bacterium]|nr:hypothetical protein [Desulfobacteraceae bacterium]
MEYNKSRNIGMELLIQEYKKKFETEENFNYYAHKDFLQAERKYLKYMLEGPIDEQVSQSY